jgi:hypothetical protein
VGLTANALHGRFHGRSKAQSPFCAGRAWNCKRRWER